MLFVRRMSTAIPVGCTEPTEALFGCLERGLVRLVTTSFSPHARRYCSDNRRMKVRVSGRA